MLGLKTGPGMVPPVADRSVWRAQKLGTAAGALKMYRASYRDCIREVWQDGGPVKVWYTVVERRNCTRDGGPK